MLERGGLVGDCLTVAARLCAALQGASSCVNPDAVPAADGPGEWLQLANLMTTLSQVSDDVRAHPALDVDAEALEGPHAGRLDRGLDMHAKVERVQQHLQRRLEDSEAPRRANAQRQLAVAGDD